MTKAAKHVNCCSDGAGCRGRMSCGCGGNAEGGAMEDDWMDEVMLDEAVMDEAVMDEAVMDEAVMNEAVMNEAVMNEAVMNEAVMNEAVMNEAVMDAHREVHDEEANDMQGSEKGTQAGAFSAGEKTEVTYHTLLPRYLQDALRRAAGSYGAGTLKRQIMVNHAAAAAAREFPQRFVHEEE